tara:strand:+ start:520 stop:1356 length:837 start_codon:yes stop_codon:yes gene_type:complete
MNDFDLNALQKKILELVSYFDYFCNEHNIKYYLMGGTALGAVRHRGFIPWDDDFDVFMDNYNYNKFIEMATTELDTDKYYFQKENTKEWPLFFSKLRINGTTFIEKDVVGRDMHHGIYIDIMCLNGAFENIIFRGMQYIAARGLSARALIQRGYTTNSIYKKTLLTLASIVISNPIQNLLLKFVRMLNHKDTKFVGHFFGRAPFKRTTFLRDYLGKSRYIYFDDLKLPVPYKVENYLTVRYGSNYMEMPSEEVKAKYPSHAFIIDINESYEKYLNIKN